MKIKIISGLILLSISGLSYSQYADVEQLNETASCDSTCSLDPSTVKTLSGQNQRVSNCGYGYIGQSLQERIINQDGSWSDWRETNRDNCVCSPLTENQEVVCPINQRGQHIETRNWTCPSVAQGQYTQWVTKSNTCDYYYISTSAEEQTIACPLNQRGTHIQTRNYENWSDDSKRNQTAWITKSNTCDYYLISASQNETIIDNCPNGQSGSITKTRSYDVWSDGNRNYSAWSELSNTCQASFPSGTCRFNTNNYVAQWQDSNDPWGDATFTVEAAVVDGVVQYYDYYHNYNNTYHNPYRISNRYYNPWSKVNKAPDGGSNVNNFVYSQAILTSFLNWAAGYGVSRNRYSFITWDVCAY